MARCFVTRELPGAALERLRDAHAVETWAGDSPPTRQALLAGAATARGLLSLLTDAIDAELIEACPDLVVISNYAVGVDNVDVDAATARGIPVGHTPEVLTDSTADLAVALMLAVARRLTEGEMIVRSGRWGAWSPGCLPRTGPARCDGGDRRRGAHRIDGRPPARGLRLRGRARGPGRGRAGGRAVEGGLRQRPHPAHGRDQRADRRAAAAGHEADRVSRQHRARPDRRRHRARAGAARGLDRRRGSRRHRPGAPAGRPPAARSAEPARDPAPRLRHPPDAGGDGRPRGRQPARRPRRRAPPLRQPRGLRAASSDAGPLPASERRAWPGRRKPE